MFLEEKRRYWYTRCADLDGPDADLKLDSVTIYHGGHNCSENSICINTFGSYYCHCYKGWKGKLCDEGTFLVSGIKNASSLRLPNNRFY
ncbi:EGF-like domain protein [Trichuris suis]|nr:EGF-like domain protein [Trichuris suis]